MWRRWEPHIHPPGTLFNDEYPSGDEGWKLYLAAIETAEPPVSAVGVTDYYGLDVYEEFLRRAAGQLPGVELVFPNIELRLNTGTGKAAINLHLIVSPNDPDHATQIRQFLKGLTFEAFGRDFHCDPDDLRALGRRHKPDQTDDRALLAEGANQFKVDFKQLRTAWRKNTWVQDNVLVAVAGSSRDGTAGLGSDHAFDTLRAEIEAFAHIIFASTPAQRTFWLGHGGLGRAELEARYNGRKPCLHGSDAHGLTKVLKPDLDRRCWLKGDATFESLRQAALEPEDRVFIGTEPEVQSLPSQVISEIQISRADWLPNPRLPLNSGLICVIGARGSGKTALADILAAGAYSASSQVNDRSFLRRARPALREEAVKLAWADGETTGNSLSAIEIEDLLDSSRVQYLSQQFVDQLCAADGVTTELMSEIHRVIFQAHSQDARLGATDFEDLLAMKCAGADAAHRSQAEALATISEEIRAERELIASLEPKKRERENLLQLAAKLKADRAALIPRGDAERAAALDALSRAVEVKSQAVEAAERRQQALLALKQDVTVFRDTTAPTHLRQLRTRHAEAGLPLAEWERFKPEYAGDVDGAIQAGLNDVDGLLKTLRGRAPAGDGPFIGQDADLSVHALLVLQAEQTRLQKLVGIDRDKANRIAQLTQKVAADEAAAAKLEREIEIAAGASDRVKKLQVDRTNAYRGVIAALSVKQRQLEALYTPLKARLDEEIGALAKLSFEVRRTADVAAWAAQGEELLDVRKAGEFRGRGRLAELATGALKAKWEAGAPDEIASALSAFFDAHRQDFIDQAAVESTDRVAYRAWAADLTRWFYSVDHIEIAYSVRYEGSEIEQLSPGTRGIVLLLLYLAVDREDLRPLVIDQPEENLDPKSIFDELVPRFRTAKQRRQVMIVTHNANLVVNTDADQVIIASCGPHRPDALPEISYASGGLESFEIRKGVCDILEGGEVAFQERARRLRVRLPPEAEG
ncbi:MAG: TrlF family AAA-like ATPase [Pseudomonadota bacterium]